MESRGLIVLARFDGRTVLREPPGDIQGVWRDGEADAESVGCLVQLADAEDAELLVGHDPDAWVEWPHAPKPFA